MTRTIIVVVAVVVFDIVAVVGKKQIGVGEINRPEKEARRQF